MVLLGSEAHATGLEALFLAGIVAALTLTGLAGVFLLRQHPLGETFSVAAQAIQLPVILGMGYTYEYQAGLGLTILIGPQVGAAFHANLGTILTISTTATDKAPAFGVNVVAGIALFFLLKYADEGGPVETPSGSA
jgi:hypothetical protein